MITERIERKRAEYIESAGIIPKSIRMNRATQLTLSDELVKTCRFPGVAIATKIMDMDIIIDRNLKDCQLIFERLPAPSDMIITGGF